MSRTKYFLARTIQTVVMIFLIVTFLFLFFRLLPGDFADTMLFGGADPATVEAFREQWGLNDPIYVQYFRYMINLIQFDAGQSMVFKQPVWEFVKMKIFNSFILIGPAITAAYIVGSLTGIITATKGGNFERYITAIVIVLGTLPAFFTSILLIIIFSGWLNLLPPSGMVQTESIFNEGSWWESYLTMDFLQHYILPFTAVFMRYLYLPLLIMRTNVVEVMQQDFFSYHRITGLPRFNRLKHVGKHASLPVITLYPLSMTRAIGGLVLVEVVFNWPGIGHALVRAVFSRDYPVVQFVFFLLAAFIVIANFAVDMLYGVIDPRISVGEESN